MIYYCQIDIIEIYHIRTPEHKINKRNVYRLDSRIINLSDFRHNYMQCISLMIISLSICSHHLFSMCTPSPFQHNSMINNLIYCAK